MQRDVSGAPNRNWAFCRALFEELARAGVRHVCVCPGSRSAPLAACASGHEALRCWSLLDERSAGFFALGLAKASRAPVALLCTSGTAAANFHPAVIEASYARVPLLVLTADRPAELRDWGAGQSIDQLRLFGPHVRWFAEVAAPEASGALLRYARALACRAVDAARAAPPGPVHLNFPLREPLDPRPVAGDVPEDLGARDPLAARGRGEQPYTTVTRGAPTATQEQVAELAERMASCARGAIACGPLDADAALVERVARLAQRLGWPLLAEPTSQLRCGPHVGAAPVVAHADLLLRDDAFAAAHAPDFVLQLGLAPTSKAYRLWLERQPPRELVRIDPDAGWNDPSHLTSQLLCAEPNALCDALLAQLPARGASPWLESFLDADRRAARAVEQLLQADDALLEARAVRELAACLPDDTVLYVSNSMPVRDLDAFLPASARRLRVLCNRGANGIDGMISSALGAAAANPGPVVLLTGDLALLHDCAALLAAQRLALPLVIVVLDNDGGGIFSFLPVARFGAAVSFETHFRTPHGIDLEPLCRAMGAAFARASSWEHLRAALKDALTTPRVSVLAVPVDRDRNIAQFHALEAAVAAALGAREQEGAP
ncbi:MAG: 2-succinyl-5-enolpyruvyl-6-hydroxy-3-cyclohexene-1-carboxylic-acid synthase [Myxococcales bacterium]|nr:2-succinyl-5-enolpyruvyl-6-hydroxy-3-cyclohexene-1-carboxylic-acid synthase [Myxococcales bacterium]MDH5565243.1 2-succinyl-5-enolpyruvyl-6-hydroxy-3-cyclohexene-1-carboxylic-acid synthase [Myxococcales bacterium]